MEEREFNKKFAWVYWVNLLFGVIGLSFLLMSALDTFTVNWVAQTIVNLPVGIYGLYLIYVKRVAK